MQKCIAKLSFPYPGSHIPILLLPSFSLTPQPMLTNHTFCLLPVEVRENFPAALLVTPHTGKESDLFRCLIRRQQWDFLFLSYLQGDEHEYALPQAGQ